MSKLRSMKKCSQCTWICRIWLGFLLLAQTPYWLNMEEPRLQERSSFHWSRKAKHGYYRWFHMEMETLRFYMVWRFNIFDIFVSMNSYEPFWGDLSCKTYQIVRKSLIQGLRVHDILINKVLDFWILPRYNDIVSGEFQ